AVDGSKAEYNVVLLVAAGDDTSLSTFTVAGNDVQDGDVVEVDPYTTEVEVVAEATDVDATVDVVGGSELQPGLNSVVVTVVAADGVSFETYVVSVNVALGNNVELSSFIVNGSAVQDGDSVDLGYGVTEVTVLVDTVDLDASYVVSGDTDLVSGENSLTVVVTAADGETTATYTVTLNVAFNSDASLALFQVNGLDVVDGAVVDLDPYTSSVEVVAKASDSDATVVIEGGADLQPGENTLTVTVTAADGETQLVYTVILNVLLSSDNSLKTFTVNGVEVVDGESVELDPYTSSVEVVVEASDANATVEVDGGDGLEAGENALTVTVTAANGDVAVYNVTLVVLLSGVIDLSVFTVNGVDVLGLTSNSIDLAPYTTEVEVEVVTVDENATFEITGGTDLQPGENSLTVVVTAPNGDTYEYGVTLVVALGNNTELASFQVDGEDVSDGDVVDLAPYTTEVEVVVETVDPDATFGG
ncbi:MAG: hypothetical protein EBU13_09710, partial [Synechococcaceae bacterium WB5_2A_257]|nr:hypothetical protein [Synechococcaceae bacterium WB5_2A_257]